MRTESRKPKTEHEGCGRFGHSGQRSIARDDRGARSHTKPRERDPRDIDVDVASSMNSDDGVATPPVSSAAVSRSRGFDVTGLPHFWLTSAPAPAPRSDETSREFYTDRGQKTGAVDRKPGKARSFQDQVPFRRDASLQINLRRSKPDVSGCANVAQDEYAAWRLDTNLEAIGNRPRSEYEIEGRHIEVDRYRPKNVTVAATKRRQPVSGDRRRRTRQGENREDRDDPKEYESEHSAHEQPTSW